MFTFFVTHIAGLTAVLYDLLARITSQKTLSPTCSLLREKYLQQFGVKKWDVLSASSGSDGGR